MINRVDPRYLIAFGFAAAGIALLHMTVINQDMDFKTIVTLRIYQMAGVAFLFVPIQTLCYVGIPMEKNNNISGMINLARNMGGSIGIAGLETVLQRKAQAIYQTMLAYMQRGRSGVHRTSRG